MRHLQVLNKLLNTKVESIPQLQATLFNLSDILKDDVSTKNLSYFPLVYGLVTREVWQQHLLDNSKHFGEFAMLDIDFGNRYLRALKTFLNNETVPDIWKDYFIYCHNTDAKPLVCLLLGINAHINGDLLNSLIDCNFLDVTSYNKVNKVMVDLVPEVIWLILGVTKNYSIVLAYFFKPLVSRQVKRLILGWRSDIWAKYLIYKKTNKTTLPDVSQLASLIKQEYSNTFKLGLKTLVIK